MTASELTEKSKEFGDIWIFHVRIQIFHSVLIQVTSKQDFLLTRFSPMLHFYTPWKREKTRVFLTFSEGTEMWHWTKMG